MSVLVSKEQKRFEAFEANVEWFISNYKHLKKKYNLQYVAVNAGEVIDHDSDPDRLIARLRTHYEDISTFVIEYVGDHDTQLIL